MAYFGALAASSQRDARPSAPLSAACDTRPRRLISTKGPCDPTFAARSWMQSWGPLSIPPPLRMQDPCAIITKAHRNNRIKPY